MKDKIKKMLVSLMAVAPLITSCSANPEDWIVQVKDSSKLYIGGYKTVKEKESTGTYDYCLYLKFENSDVAFSSSSNDLSYDLEIDLNTGYYQSYGQTGDKTGDNGDPVFCDIGSFYENSVSNKGGTDIATFFTDGNYISIFTSVGKLDKDRPYVSKKARIGTSGQFVCVSTIGSSGEELSYSVAYIYKEKFAFGGNE